MHQISGQVNRGRRMSVGEIAYLLILTVVEPRNQQFDMLESASCDQ
jgi:hypothetical protein